ncbi:hypothetical protein [Xylanibacter rodentium]|uniref:hypothetical protein n=1 Tax=Xylanibacter rodentium TaxID=2736289 RepID=UPI0025944514|nr:hypothetical protein [Xylanibacter rodentium]
MRMPQYFVEMLPEQVKKEFLYWTEYMESNLVFSLPDSELHTKEHCGRVLLYALLIGIQVSGCGKEGLCALAHASIFHDTCRQDDFLDVGHGARAASYYMKYCEQNKDLVFLEPAYLIMKYHDRDDKIGMEAIANARQEDKEQVIRLYGIFKDADALDRFRLGANGLDTRFLRTPEAMLLVDFARDLVKQTV